MAKAEPPNIRENIEHPIAENSAIIMNLMKQIAGVLAFIVMNRVLVARKVLLIFR